LSKIEFLREELLNWFDLNGRDFPWRKKRLSSYKIVISEILLQRTKAESVSQYYSGFIEKFPSWKILANAEPKQLEIYLQPLGLSKQKSLRLSLLAKEMVTRKGKFPENRSELDSIPFIGQYIANAIELFIFGKSSPLLDVNMARLIERFFQPRKLADIRYDPYLQKMANRIVNTENSVNLNWAILDFAALICTAQNPKCNVCVLRRNCSFYRLNHIS